MVCPREAYPPAYVFWEIYLQSLDPAIEAGKNEFDHIEEVFERIATVLFGYLLIDAEVLVVVQSIVKQFPFGEFGPALYLELATGFYYPFNHMDTPWNE